MKLTDLPECPTFEGHWIMVAPVIWSSHFSKQDFEALDRISFMSSDETIVIDIREPYLTKAALSNECLTLLRSISAKQYGLLRIDADGTVYDELPVHNW